VASKQAEGQAVYQQWLDSLATSDPELHKELVDRLASRIATPESVQPASSGGISLESAAREAGVDVRAIALETIVREGRPALLIQENRIKQDGAMADAAAKTLVERLVAAAPLVEPLIPLVGRIDVENYPAPIDYVGTGWLVDRNIVVTNRHVAELIARSDNGKFRFRPGRFGEDMRVTLDYRHEKDLNTAAVSRVLRVIWIEPDTTKADIAFLEVDRRTDGTMLESIPRAKVDAKPNDHVAVIGYPARASAEVIPNQAWMDQIYGGTYDIKRIAPGLMRPNNRGWATHDCTTLGGNSGSLVVNMKGQAVALHFAGLYMIENYAVPVSTINEYLANPPWNSSPTRIPEMLPDNNPHAGGGAQAAPPPTPSQSVTNAGVETRVGNGQVSVTIPLTVTVSLGLLPQPPPTLSPVSPSEKPAVTPPLDIEGAARQLLQGQQGKDVLSVYPGYKLQNGRLTNVECLVVSARPNRLKEVQSAMPRMFGKFPVEVRPASLGEQLGGPALTEAPGDSIQYNDDDRTGEGFSFNWVDEEMTVILHVGPERSWTVLSEFLGGTKKELISSIYEFHAAHIAKAIEQQLTGGAEMTLVLARQSRDPKSGKIPEGDFSRKETFARWEKNFSKFDHIFVPLGARGLVANSYHIKVTVRDRSSCWLSSGNQKRSSQPLIADADLNKPKVTGAAGNREWHVVMENPTLANRFRNHILADYEQSKELGGTLEAVDDEIMIDVPETLLEGVEFEAAPSRVLEPLRIERRIRVKPLLTPDKKGAVYTKAVLQLIRSAKKQLLLQNQYIKMSGANSGNLKQLVDALAEKAQELDDFRIILRDQNEDLLFDLSELKRRGIDVNTQVRILSNTHTKGIIVDGERVLVGSHNLSSSGVTLNRDASLIFDDEEAAQYYAEAFEIDWNRSREPKFEEAVSESVRLAEGDAPPLGYKRIRLSDYLEG
jgi:V8-like Glu-specific endopeptidase